jgi:hypothetical protein
MRVAGLTMLGDLLVVNGGDGSRVNGIEVNEDEEKRRESKSKWLL